MDDVLITQLAAMPPHLWPRAIHRYKILADYAAKPDATVHDVEDSAKLLGVGVRAFYRLLRAFKAVQNGQLPAPSRHGLSRHIGDEAEQLIHAAVQKIGLGARLRKVQRELERLCQDQSLPLPSERSIRTRLGDKPATSRLRARMKSNHDWLLDSCALRIPLTTLDAGAEMAYVLAMFEIDSGQVLSHRIVAGPPLQDDIEDFLDQLSGAPQSERGRSIGATRYLARLFEQRQSMSRSNDRFAAIDPNYVGRTALGFASVFGSRIGRIELSAFALTAHKLDYSLSLSEVAPVVASLISQRNAELVSVRECPRSRPII